MLAVLLSSVKLVISGLSKGDNDEQAQEHGPQGQGRQLGELLSLQQLA